MILCKVEVGLVVYCIIIAIICTFPLLYHMFGKEDQCGRTWWDKYRASKKK